MRRSAHWRLGLSIPLLAATLAGGFAVAQQPRRTAQRPVRVALPEEEVPAPNKEVDAYIRAEMGRQRLVGLALGIVRDGKPVYLKGYGWEDREARQQVAAHRTLFRWASISKTLTAIAAKKLEREGKLDLDSPVSGYVPEFPAPTAYLRECGEESATTVGESELVCEDGFFEIPLGPDERFVTARMLLGHQGGIMHYSNGRGSPVPPAELTNDPEHNTGIKWTLEYFADRPLVNKPREKVSYSTFAFNLLGTVVESVGKRSLAAQVHETISNPLGLDTLQPDYEWNSLPRRAVGYQLERPESGSSRDRANRADAKIVRQGSNDVSWKLPGGGFVSSVEDLASYCGGLMSEKILPREVLEEMWVPQKLASGTATGYGLSFRVGDHDGHRHVSHGGSQEKTKTMLLLSPDDNLCVVVMSNSTNATPRTIAQGVEDIYRKQMSEPKKAN